MPYALNNTFIYFYIQQTRLVCKTRVYTGCFAFIIYICVQCQLAEWCQTTAHMCTQTLLKTLLCSTIWTQNPQIAFKYMLAKPEICHSVCYCVVASYLVLIIPFVFSCVSYHPCFCCLKRAKCKKRRKTKKKQSVTLVNTSRVKVGTFFHRKSKFLDMVTKELRECVDITNQSCITTISPSMFLFN